MSWSAESDICGGGAGEGMAFVRKGEELRGEGYQSQEIWPGFLVEMSSNSNRKVVNGFQMVPSSKAAW